jgi:hypothetical protein
MRKFRKKPVVIEAVQLAWGAWSEVCDFVGPDFAERGFRGCCIDENGKETSDSTDRIGMKIPTLEGTMLAIQDDWIIKGVKGELYPCKPDIFAATYEPVE